MNLFKIVSKREFSSRIALTTPLSFCLMTDFPFSPTPYTSYLSLLCGFSGQSLCALVLLPLIDFCRGPLTTKWIFEKVFLHIWGGIFQMNQTPSKFSLFIFKALGKTVTERSLNAVQQPRRSQDSFPFFWPWRCPCLVVSSAVCCRQFTFNKKE